MKKLCLLFISVIMCAALTLSCFAEFENYAISDFAEVLSYEEWEILDETAEELREAYNIDVAVIIEAEMTGSTAEETADDFYDYNGFGVGENDDGIMLYVSTEEREYHITTTGDGIRIFNDKGLELIAEEIEPYLRDDDYYGASEEFLKQAEFLLKTAAEGEPYGSESDSTYFITVIVCAVLITFLIAFIAMKMKLSKMKTAVANNYAANYMKEGSKNISISRDIFLYSLITKEEKPKDDSDSTTHTSSSGSTHGGRGGSF